MRLGLSYDDVLLLPHYSDILPQEIDTSVNLADGLTLKIPILSAAMDTVTESHMATALALSGGAGVIHRNLSISAQAREIMRVKDSLSWIIRNPITVGPNATLRETSNVMEERSIGGIPIVQDGVLLGLVTHKDLVLGTDDGDIVSNIMVKNPICYKGSDPSYQEMSEMFRISRVGRIPLVDQHNILLGMVCLNDFSKKQLDNYEDAAVGSDGRLIVGAAISPHGYLERVETIVKAGVNFIVIDSAHGNSKNVISAIKELRSTYPTLMIIGGNVATADGTERIIKAGADIVKVGMGPGSICTTRIVSGMGVPQFTAVQDCVKAAQKMGKKVIADGGIRYSGDITKAIGAGACSVMLGSLLAGLEETPGKNFNHGGKMYKLYRGMGSASAITEGGGDRYFFSSGENIVPEGVESRVTYKGDLRPFLYQLVVGLKKGMGYCGCSTLTDLMNYQEFIQVTHAGVIESHVHDVTEL